MTDNKSEQAFLPDQIKELFGFELATQLFIAYCCFFFYCQYYVYIDYVSGANGLTFPDSDTVTTISFPYTEATSIAVCCHYGVYADPRFFLISASTELRTVPCP